MAERKGTVEIEMVRVHKDAKLPTKSYEFSAGWDLYSAEDVTLSPGDRKIVRTGLIASIPEAYYAKIEARSGLAIKHGITTLCGVIDPDYRGEWGVVLTNTDPRAKHRIKVGDKIAQFVVHTNWHSEIEEKKRPEDLTKTKRGEQGYGSSGS